MNYIAYRALMFLEK